MNPPRNLRDVRAAAHRPDGGEAFLPDGAIRDRDAQYFAGEFLTSATTGEASEMDAADEVVDEEWGGPFLEVDAEEGDETEAIPQPPRLHELPPTVR